MRRFFLLMLGIGLLAIIVLVGIPAVALHYYGPPSPDLSIYQAFQYSARLLWDDGLLTRPLNPTGAEQPFKVQQGEPIELLATRLQQAGLIRDAGALRDYLIYTGLDTS